MPSNYSNNLKYYYREGRASFSSDYHAYVHLPEEKTLTIQASHEARCANPQYMIDNGHIAAKGLYNLGFLYDAH